MYEKVNWSKMHTHEYNGNCVYCGGKCTDLESISEWDKAFKNLTMAKDDEDYPKIRYYTQKIEKCQNFKMTY